MYSAILWCTQTHCALQHSFDRRNAAQTALLVIHHQSEVVHVALIPTPLHVHFHRPGKANLTSGNQGYTFWQASVSEIWRWRVRSQHRLYGNLHGSSVSVWPHGQWSENVWPRTTRRGTKSCCPTAKRSTMGQGKGGNSHPKTHTHKINSKTKNIHLKLY